MADFKNMTRDEALEYCHKHRNKFMSEAYACDEDGKEQYDCLVSIVEDGTIQPSELPDYGMEFE